MVVQVVAAKVALNIIGTALSQIGKGGSKGRGDSAFARLRIRQQTGVFPTKKEGRQFTRGELTADQLRAQHGIYSGPTVADQLPAPSPSPWWAAAPLILFPNAAQRKKRVRAKRLKGARAAAGRWGQTARDKLLPQLAKKFPWIGRYAEASRGGAWVLGPMLAWDVGRWIGTKAYEAYWRERPAPAVVHRARASLPYVRVTAKKIPMPAMPARPGVPRPPSSSPQRARAAQYRITWSPAPGSLPVFTPSARTMPAPSPAPATSPVVWPRPIPASVARAVKIARIAAPLALAGLARSSSPGRKSVKVSDVSQAYPELSTDLAPLTELQAEAVPSARKAKCRCPKQKKRSGKKRCSNPIVRKRRTTRGGQVFVTTTRRMQCPA